MKNTFFLIALFSVQFFLSQQNASKWFGEAQVGIVNIKGRTGVLGGASFNKTYKDNIFGLRYNYIYNKRMEGEAIFLIIPIFFKESELKVNELALLYGKYWRQNRLEYGFSGGISYNNSVLEYYDNDNLIISDKTDYIGIPLEVNLRVIRNKRGVSNFVGVKFLGTVSKQSYGGVAFVFGLGPER